MLSTDEGGVTIATQHVERANDGERARRVDTEPLRDGGTFSLEALKIVDHGQDSWGRVMPVRRASEPNSDTSA